MRTKDFARALVSPVVVAIMLSGPVAHGQNNAAPVTAKIDPVPVGSQAAPPVVHVEQTLVPSITDAPVFVEFSPAGLVANVTGGLISKTKPWDKIDISLRSLINNTWGAAAGEGLLSSIYHDPARGFGWSWDRHNPQPPDGETNVKPIYPSVRIGGSPWEKSSITSFPVRLSDLKSLYFDLTYSYVQAPTGNFNLAYDIFLSDTNLTSSTPKPNAEVMIWLQNTMQQPPKYSKGEFSDGSNTFNLYSWVMASGRQYYSFVLKDQSSMPGLSSVDAGRLIESLGLNPDLYIHGIELGNEVMNGSGKIEITRFVVTLNGRTL